MKKHQMRRGILCGVGLAGMGAASLWPAGTALAAPLQGEAFQRATAAYAAIARNDLAAAERDAHAAVTAQPDSADAVRLLMDVYTRQGKAAAAIAAANEAVARAAADTDLYLARGYLLLAAKENAAAAADFSKVLNDTALAADKQRNVRLALADAAAAQQQHQIVLTTLHPLSGEHSYEVKAREGFAAFALDKIDQAAAAFAIAAASAKTPEEYRTALKGQAQAEAARGNTAVVKQLVLVLMDSAPTCDLDLAYVLLRVGDDAGALNIFEGRCVSSMTAASEMDAGYAAQRLSRNPAAIAHFSAALDRHRASAEPFDPQTEFDVRRSVDSLSREFGLTIGAFYRADRSAAGGGNVGQGIAEAYWQPPVVGYRNGRVLQIYSRLSANALAPGASTVQSSSTQAAFGARYKPFSDVNLVAAAERLVPIGSTAISDWLLRAGYSASFNTDIQPTTKFNTMGVIYGEADYLVNQDRFIGSIDGRYGFDHRLGSSEKLTGSVFVNAAYNYDSAEIRKSAMAIGPGVGVKYWFRESKNRGPASSVQLDLMYRFKATPSDRAAGLVLQLSLSF